MYTKLVAKVNNIDTSDFVLKTKYQTDKIELEKEIPNMSQFVKKAKLTELENKIPDVSSLGTKTASTVVQNKISSVSNLVNLSSLNGNVTENKTKNLLIENELNKLKTFASSYFIGKSHFEEDSTQNYLVFQPINRYFKVIANTDYVSSWKSKGLSAESIKPPTTSDYSLTPVLNYYGPKTRVKFTESC